MVGMGIVTVNSLVQGSHISVIPNAPTIQLLSGSCKKCIEEYMKSSQFLFIGAFLTTILLGGKGSYGVIAKLLIVAVFIAGGCFLAFNGQ